MYGALDTCVYRGKVPDKLSFRRHILIVDLTAEEIQKKRKQIGITQKEFADALGLGRDGQRQVRGWELDEHKPCKGIMRAIHDFPTEPVFPEPERPRFTFIDLFAGIGGIRYPFQKLGGKCVFTSEWDKFAQKTYRINYGGKDLHGDITQVDEKKIPDHNILLAGFPCQPFSQAGLQKGFADTRGTMFFELERIVKEKKPEAILLENVKRFRSHDKGRTYATIECVLDKLGYFVRSKVLRAADFGVPQNRERIFIVCFKKELFGNSKDNFTYQLPEGPCTPTKVGTILDPVVDDKYTISDKLYQGHLRRRKEHAKRGNGFGFCTVNADSTHANTISARYYKDGSEILVEQKGKNPRKLTPSECKKLQGFPEKFVIPVSDTQAYRQFGNSVCVPVVEAVAKSMVQVLEGLNSIS